jgi:hypothetical protein
MVRLGQGGGRWTLHEGSVGVSKTAADLWTVVVIVVLILYMYICVCVSEAFCLGVCVDAVTVAILRS